MRDFERIELLIKDMDNLDNSLRNESKRLRKMSNIYFNRGMDQTAFVLLLIASSYQNIILEKHGIYTKEQLDEEMRLLAHGFDEPKEKTV